MRGFGLDFNRPPRFMMRCEELLSVKTFGSKLDCLSQAINAISLLRGREGQHRMPGSSFWPLVFADPGIVDCPEDDHLASISASSLLMIGLAIKSFIPA